VALPCGIARSLPPDYRGGMAVLMRPIAINLAGQHPVQRVACGAVNECHVEMTRHQDAQGDRRELVAAED
jgi:hypothetical protein